MRLWVFSDLKLTSHVATPLEIPPADVCVVAGDINLGGPEHSIAWLAEHVCPSMPVVFVAGNREFYRTGYIESLARGREVAACIDNLHFLENDEIIIGDIAFAGATLWTDHEIMGHRPFAANYCEMMMDDYYQIAISMGRRSKKLRASHTAGFHRDSRKFLSDFLDRHRGSRTVVVSHHAPSRYSIAPRFANDLSSAAFASDLAALIIERGPDLWIHGHVHERFGYKLGKTRVLCNPRGYPGAPGFEDFDFAKVVEV